MSPTRWIVLAVCLSACATPDEPTAQRGDPTPDRGHPDAGRDAALDMAPDRDAAVEVAPPLDPGCGPPPVRVHDRVAWPDATGIDLGDARHTWPDDAQLVHVGATPMPDPSAAQVFVTLHRPVGCRIDALDDSATLRWRLDLPGARCTGATVDPQRVVQPITDPDGDALLILARDDGAVLDRVPLPAAPTTPAAYGGVIENGGSHWYVGASGSLIRHGIEDGRTESLALPFDPRALALASPEHGLVVGDPDAALPGLGSAAQRVRLGADWAPVGPALALPSTAWAPPVTLPPCPKLDANGGSHWWCGEGMFALAGEGWSGAWSLRDGRAFYLADQLDPALRVTGLAVGRDGLVYNGGSHWATGAWTLWALHPLEARMLLDGAGPPETCLPSPLLDTDSTLRTRAGALIEAPTTAGGLPLGWARAGGDAAGGGRTVAPGCAGGDDERFTRVHRATPPVEPTVLGRFEGDVVMAGTAAVDGRTAIWVGRLAPDGVFRWTELLPERPEIDPATQPPLVIVPRRDDELQLITAGDFMTTIGLTADGTLRGVSRTRDNGRGRTLTTVSAGPPDLIIAGTYRDPAVDEPQHWILPYIDGFLGAEVFMRDVEPLTPLVVATLAPGWVIGARAPSGAIVRAVDADGEGRWRQTLDGDGVEIVDVAVAVDQRVFVLATDVDGGRLLVLDGATGAVQGESRIAAATPVRFALGPDGGGLYLTDDLRMGRVTAAGALLPPDPLPRTGRAVDLVGWDGGVFAAGLSDDGIVFARADSAGRASCEAAGRCVVTGPCAAAENACSVSICAPRDGSCGPLPLSDEAPCGPGLTCGDGMCGP